MHATTNLEKCQTRRKTGGPPRQEAKNGKFDEYGKCSEFTKFVTKQQGNVNDKTIR